MADHAPNPSPPNPSPHRRWLWIALAVLLLSGVAIFALTGEPEQHDFSVSDAAQRTAPQSKPKPKPRTARSDAPSSPGPVQRDGP